MAYKHLSKEQRSIIEFMIHNNFNFTKIGQAINNCLFLQRKPYVCNGAFLKTSALNLKLV